MIRKLLLAALAVGLFSAVNPSGTANAQGISIGRGGVGIYNGYGRGYYGGGYGPGVRVYSGYGNGPYGYGAGYGRGYYNGYGRAGVYVQPGGFYRPYGGGYYNNYYGW